MTATPVFQIEAGGLLTTVQDLGRAGHQRDGVPVSGAMDTFAASVANLLVGNPRGAALLEITWQGPTLRALSPIRVALCGADLSATLDDGPVPLWKTLTVRDDQILAFGRRRAGARAYLAVEGGLEAPMVLGSRSTFLRAGLGGLGGRSLRAYDRLEASAHACSLVPGERGLRRADVPIYTLPAVLRVVSGPHSSFFTETGRRTFLKSSYTLTPQSDRMGYRLQGKAIERVGPADILSEAMPFGGVQIPPDGQPILLMADRQTTGGYPLVGVVISADLPRAAQLLPGDAVGFQAVGLAEAQALAVRQEKWLRLLETRIFA